MATIAGLVPYYRVSTDKQGATGLGMEAQLAAVERYALAAGLPVLRSFREVESGRWSDRPELRLALAFARRTGAALVVAKLDRLARNVHFLSGLIESGVEFVACDNPYANRLTLHILAAVAEDEARRISERTKAALAAYKARGGLLGSARPGHPGLSPAAHAAGVAAARTAALRLAALKGLAELVRDHSGPGVSLRETARRLNAEGYQTARGKAWTAVQVARFRAGDGA
jgi:DNA invertase Pin-like site-specific DNA recombinase